MSFFSEEALLFAREYSIIEAMRTAWAADHQRFFDALRPAVETLLHEKQIHGGLSTKSTQGYLYWWIPSENSPIGNVTLWCPKEYPELIRDRRMLWHTYLELRSNVHADEADQAQWSSAAEAELRKLQPKVSTRQGGAGTFWPLSLVLNWQEDPVRECASLVADSLEALHSALLKVTQPT